MAALYKPPLPLPSGASQARFATGACLVAHRKTLVSALGVLRFVKDGNFELLDQWNTIEVIWQGDRAAHIVNGRTVNVATRLQQPDPQNPGQFIPLTRGKIAIEIEYAEIWFRRIEVKAI